MTWHFLNDIVHGVESTLKINNYFIITSLKSNPTFKLINRMQGSLDIKFTRLSFENA